MIRRIAELSGINILQLESDKILDDRFNYYEIINDNYFIVKLFKSDLAYLEQQLIKDAPIITNFTYYTERRFPSHVYKRLGVLEAQLIELGKWVKKVPTWLGGENT